MGDAVPIGLFFITACIMIFVVPLTGSTNAIAFRVFLVPLIVAIVYKALRGDKRGTKGRRLP